MARSSHHGCGRARRTCVVCQSPSVKYVKRREALLDDQIFDELSVSPDDALNGMTLADDSYFGDDDWERLQDALFNYAPTPLRASFGDLMRFV